MNIHLGATFICGIIALAIVILLAWLGSKAQADRARYTLFVVMAFLLWLGSFVVVRWIWDGAR